jgi:predicted PurR-regulated permease PerM
MLVLESSERHMKRDRALAWLATAAVVAILWVGRQFATGILLGALLAFTLEPFYRKLLRSSRRDFVAALAVVLSTAVVIVGAIAGFGTLFVTRAAQLANVVREGLKPGGSLHTWVDTVGGWLSRFGMSTDDLTTRLQEGAGQIASSSAAIAGSFASGTLSLLLNLFFALLTMHVVLRYWQRIVGQLIAVAPLPSEYTLHLLAEFKRVGRMIISGTVLTGLAQGVLAAIGFWMTGLPMPIFFGTTTALASLIPAVGTLLVWVPAGIYLIATGHVGHGVLELCWGALVVVGFSDYVIRPHLVGDESMPALLVFIALFGGIETFGLPGLIIGPLIMALGVAVLRLYAQENVKASA